MYKQIAKRMGVAYGTVHAHVKTIYKEHDVHSRAELVAHLGRADAEIPHSPSTATSAL